MKKYLLSTVAIGLMLGVSVSVGAAERECLQKAYTGECLRWSDASAEIAKEQAKKKEDLAQAKKGLKDAQDTLYWSTDGRKEAESVAQKKLDAAKAAYDSSVNAPLFSDIKTSGVKSSTVTTSVDQSTMDSFNQAIQAQRNLNAAQQQSDQAQQNVTKAAKDEKAAQDTWYLTTSGRKEAEKEAADKLAASKTAAEAAGKELSAAKSVAATAQGKYTATSSTSQLLSDAKNTSTTGMDREFSDLLDQTQSTVDRAQNALTNDADYQNQVRANQQLAAAKAAYNDDPSAENQQLLSVAESKVKEANLALESSTTYQQKKKALEQAQKNQEEAKQIVSEYYKNQDLSTEPVSNDAKDVRQAVENANTKQQKSTELSNRLSDLKNSMSDTDGALQNANNQNSQMNYLEEAKANAELSQDRLNTNIKNLNQEKDKLSDLEKQIAAREKNLQDNQGGSSRRPLTEGERQQIQKELDALKVQKEQVQNNVNQLEDQQNRLLNPDLALANQNAQNDLSDAQTELDTLKAQKEGLETAQLLAEGAAETANNICANEGVTSMSCQQAKESAKTAQSNYEKSQADAKGLDEKIAAAEKNVAEKKAAANQTKSALDAKKSETKSMSDADKKKQAESNASNASKTLNKAKAQAQLKTGQFWNSLNNFDAWYKNYGTDEIQGNYQVALEDTLTNVSMTKATLRNMKNAASADFRLTATALNDTAKSTQESAYKGAVNAGLAVENDIAAASKNTADAKKALEACKAEPGCTTGSQIIELEKAYDEALQKETALNNYKNAVGNTAQAYTDYTKAQQEWALDPDNKELQQKAEAAKQALNDSYNNLNTIGKQAGASSTTAEAVSDYMGDLKVQSTKMDSAVTSAAAAAANYDLMAKQADILQNASAGSLTKKQQSALESVKTAEEVNSAQQAADRRAEMAQQVAKAAAEAQKQKDAAAAAQKEAKEKEQKSLSGRVNSGVDSITNSINNGTNYITNGVNYVTDSVIDGVGSALDYINPF